MDGSGITLFESFPRSFSSHKRPSSTLSRNWDLRGVVVVVVAVVVVMVVQVVEVVVAVNLLK
jgi:hypothetical protein